MPLLPTQSGRWAGRYRNEIGLLFAIVAVVGLTLLFNRDYLRDPATNAKDILHQTSLLGIFALGAAIVIISGGIDLSSGSVIVFSGSICSLVMLVFAPVNEIGLRDATNVGLPIVSLAIAAALVTGLIIGTFHAWLITVMRLPPFVATLASLVGLRSLAKILNQAVTEQLGNRQTKVRADDATMELLSKWWVALVVFLVVGAICWFLMNRTVVGRHLYALGGNEEAARLSGIQTVRLKWLAYCIGGFTSSLAGVLYVAKIGAANPSTLAMGYELDAIAAAVVGGCSLQGGIGLIPGVMLGVLFLRVVIDAVQKVVPKASDDYQGMIVGFLVVLAVAFNEFRRQSTGKRLRLFPGALGVATIPVVSLLVGCIVYVMAGVKVRLRIGTTAGLVILGVLVVLKLVEIRQRKSAAGR